MSCFRFFLFVNGNSAGVFVGNSVTGLNDQRGRIQARRFPTQMLEENPESLLANEGQ